MVQNINIGLMGISGSGQMCYLLALYGVMLSKFNGFYLKNSNVIDDEELSELWNTLIYGNDLDRCRWPRATSETAIKYNFDLYYHSKKLISIDWLDCHRSAFMMHSREKTTQVFLEHIKKCSCIFLIISGEYFHHEYNDNSIISKAQIRRQLAIISQTCKNLANVNITILITKFDLCKFRTKLEIVDCIKRLYQPIFFDNRFKVMICPVSLGVELSEDLNASINPINVHLPLFFFTYCSLLEQPQNYEKEIAILAHEIQDCSIYSDGKELELYI